MLELSEKPGFLNCDRDETKVTLNADEYWVEGGNLSYGRGAIARLIESFRYKVFPTFANGSKQVDIWGADWYPLTQEVGYESLINIVGEGFGRMRNNE